MSASDSCAATHPRTRDALHLPAGTAVTRCRPRAAGRLKVVTWVALVVGLGLQACAARPTPAAEPTARAAPSAASGPTRPGATQRAAAALEAAIGTAACRDDDDCATVGVGALACGGPQGWRAWSRRDGHAAVIAARAGDHRAAREADIARSGELSVCRVVPDPGAHCLRQKPSSQTGRCTLRETGGGVDGRVR